MSGADIEKMGQWRIAWDQDVPQSRPKGETDHCFVWQDEIECFRLGTWEDVGCGCYLASPSVQSRCSTDWGWVVTGPVAQYENQCWVNSIARCVIWINPYDCNWDQSFHSYPQWYLLVFFWSSLYSGLKICLIWLQALSDAHARSSDWPVLPGWGDGCSCRSPSRHTPFAWAER